MWKRIRAALTSPAVIVLAAFVFRFALVYTGEVRAPLPLTGQVTTVSRPGTWLLPSRRGKASARLWG